MENIFFYTFQEQNRRRTKRKAAANAIRNIFGNAIIHGNESEISDLDENSDTEDTTNEFTDNLDDLSDGDLSHHDSDNEEAMAPEDEGTNEETSQMAWKKEDFSHKIPDPIVTNFSVDCSEENLENPLSYVQRFFTDEIVEDLCFQTNLFSVQNQGKSINVTALEMRQFIGIQSYFGIYNIPRTRLAWAKATRIAVIADVMPRDRYEMIRRNLHFVDNQTFVASNPDRLFKIRPFLVHLQNVFSTLPQSGRYSIDEQMVSFRGRTVLRQYMPKKPNKWGIKVFLRCDTDGMVHEFRVYDGTNPFEDRFTSGIVKDLISQVPCFVNHRLYYDNFFSSTSLAGELKQKGIYTVSTVNPTRTQGGAKELETDKVLKSRGRGSYDYRKNDGVILVKWFDNRAVHLLSTFEGVEPLSTVLRWDRKQKRHIEVQRPSIVGEYNRHMGGIDLLDFLMSRYKISMKSKKWYIKLFYSFCDMIMVMSWLLYKKNMITAFGPDFKKMDLLQFRCSASEALCKTGMDFFQRRSPGRPPATQRLVMHERKRNAPNQPNLAIRTDRTGHWPQHSEQKGKCAFCSSKTKQVFSRVKCLKCGVFLCLNKDRNCYLLFHSS